jgi:hypothetical protein
MGLTTVLYVCGQNVCNLEVSIDYCYSILNMSVGLPITRIKCESNQLYMFD